MPQTAAVPFTLAQLTEAVQWGDLDGSGVAVDTLGAALAAGEAAAEAV